MQLKTRYGQVMADMSAIESTIENDPKLEALKNSSPLKMMTDANAELGRKINTNFRRSVLASGSAGTLKKAAKQKPEEFNASLNSFQLELSPALDELERQVKNMQKRVETENDLYPSQ